MHVSYAKPNIKYYVIIIYSGFIVIGYLHFSGLFDR